MSDMFTSKTDVIMQKMLDVLSLRHELISNNITNINTPGFRRKDIDFQAQLSSLMESDDTNAIRSFKPEIIEPTDTLVKSDMNNVDIDKEITSLTKNTLMYNTYAKIVKKRYSMISRAIKGT